MTPPKHMPARHSATVSRAKSCTMPNKTNMSKAVTAMATASMGKRPNRSDSKPNESLPVKFATAKMPTWAAAWPAVRPASSWPMPEACPVTIMPALTDTASMIHIVQATGCRSICGSARSSDGHASAAICPDSARASLAARPAAARPAASGAAPCSPLACNAFPSARSAAALGLSEAGGVSTTGGAWTNHHAASTQMPNRAPQALKAAPTLNASMSVFPIGANTSGESPVHPMHTPLANPRLSGNHAVAVLTDTLYKHPLPMPPTTLYKR